MVDQTVIKRAVRSLQRRGKLKCEVFEEKKKGEWIWIKLSDKILAPMPKL